jgi:hypothetical protein
VADQTALRARLVSALDTAFQTFVSPLSDAGVGLELSEHLADAVLAVLPASVDRADVLDEAAERVTAYAADHFPDEYDDYADLLAAELRRVAAETRNTTETQTPCGPAPDECGDEPCANHERQQAHAEGEHCFCGPECSGEEVVHGCPPDGSGLTPCCGRTPFELPLGDRISSEAPTTCPGAPS